MKAARIKPSLNRTEKRAQILRSAIASFRIEGISISNQEAIAVLKKIELNLEKSSV
jgi:hypothetical protein